MVPVDLQFVLGSSDFFFFESFLKARSNCKKKHFPDNLSFFFFWLFGCSYTLNYLVSFYCSILGECLVHNDVMMHKYTWNNK